jgi:hypothetical protein
VISRPLCFRDKNQDIRLTHMFVISPSLQPSMANVITEERERIKLLSYMQQNMQKSKSSLFGAEDMNLALNNNVLFTNPLFFHGMRMIRMLKGFFIRVKYS